MHGRRPPSFFFTKKNPADAGEVDGRMKPLANSSSMYALMASDSGWERGNTLPFVGIAPGIRSIAQSLDRCGGSCDALDLLKASERSWYATGRFVVEGVSESGEGVNFTSGQWNCRHSWWQNSDHCWICFADQEIRGLCFSSQGRPRITGLPLLKLECLLAPKTKQSYLFLAPLQWPWQGCCWNLPRECYAVRRSCIPPPPYRHYRHYRHCPPPPRPFASVRFDPLAWSSGSDQRRISGYGIRWLLAGPDSLPLWLCRVCAFVLLRCFSCSHTVLPKEHSLGVIFFSSLSSCKCCIFLQFYLHFTTDYTCMIVYVTNNKEPWTLNQPSRWQRDICVRCVGSQSLVWVLESWIEPVPVPGVVHLALSTPVEFHM